MFENKYGIWLISIFGIVFLFIVILTYNYRIVWEQTGGDKATSVKKEDIYSQIFPNDIADEDQAARLAYYDRVDIIRKKYVNYSYSSPISTPNIDLDMSVVVATLYSRANYNPDFRHPQMTDVIIDELARRLINKDDVLTCKKNKEDKESVERTCKGDTNTNFYEVDFDDDYPKSLCECDATYPIEVNRKHSYYMDYNKYYYYLKSTYVPVNYAKILPIEDNSTKSIQIDNFVQEIRDWNDLYKFLFNEEQVDVNFANGLPTDILDELIPPINTMNQCTVSSKYGSRILSGYSDFHPGVDVTVGDSNKDVMSVYDGKVIDVGIHNSNDYPTCTEPGKVGSYGNYVKIEHVINGKTYVTTYGHLKENSITVTVGATVTQGQVIGIVGNTGCSSGEHLHFEIREKLESGELYAYNPIFLFANCSNSGINLDADPGIGLNGTCRLVGYKYRDGTGNYYDNSYRTLTQEEVNYFSNLPVPDENFEISQCFGYRNQNSIIHTGLDIHTAGRSKDVGSPISVIADGTVIATVTGSKTAGNYINVLHELNGKKYTSRYLHLSKIKVSLDQPVTKGQIIGIMGNTGSAIVHLHFGLYEGEDRGASVEAPLNINYLWSDSHKKGNNCTYSSSSCVGADFSKPYGNKNGLCNPCAAEFSATNFNLNNNFGASNPSLPNEPLVALVDPKTGTNTSIPMETYILGVLFGEVSPSSYSLEALKVQAVAARTYAVSKLNSQGYLIDSSGNQNYTDPSAYFGTTYYEKAFKAVTETRGLVLINKNGKIFKSEYAASCGGHTVATTGSTGVACTAFGNSHPAENAHAGGLRGLCQVGMKKYAEQGWDYQRILLYYYNDGVTIKRYY